MVCREIKYSKVENVKTILDNGKVVNATQHIVEFNDDNLEGYVMIEKVPGDKTVALIESDGVILDLVRFKKFVSYLTELLIKWENGTL